VPPPPPPPPPPPQPKRRRGWAAKLGIALAAVAGLVVIVAIVAVSTGLLHAYRAPSPSMEPTIHVGDHFLVARTSFPFSGPRRGDIIVFHPPLGSNSQECGVPSSPSDGHPCAQATRGRSPATFIKRIVAVPGDELSIRDNHVYLDGRPVAEPYVKKDTPCEELCNLPKPITIAPGHYFVLGDNRGASDDSRDWGPIDRDAIIGRFLFSYF
jgi:signal peptidase I